MASSFKLKLTRPARKAGGDRYEGIHGVENVTIYVPQSISRPKGTPLAILRVTFEEEK